MSALRRYPLSLWGGEPPQRLRHHLRRLIWIEVVCGPLLPVLAVASEAHETHAAPSISSLLFPVLNFAIFVYLLVRYAWPSVKSGLAERRRLIQEEVAEAEKVYRQVQTELREIQSRKARIQQEAEKILAQLHAEAEHERVALIEAARKTAERIRSDARRLGEQEAARAAQRIREEVALLVTQQAGEALRQRLTQPDQERFVREFQSAVESGAMA